MARRTRATAAASIACRRSLARHKAPRKPSTSGSRATSAGMCSTRSAPARPAVSPAAWASARNCAQLRRGHEIGQRGAHFPGGVEHDAHEPGLGQVLDEFHVRCEVGEKHADETRAAQRQSAERSNRATRVTARKEANLDDVGARSRHIGNCRTERLRLASEVADGGAHRDRWRQAGADGRHRRDRQGAERAARGILAVDEIGAVRGAQPRLVHRGHAGEEERRPPVPSHGSLTFRQRSAAAPPSPSPDRVDRPGTG